LTVHGVAERDSTSTHDMVPLKMKPGVADRRMVMREDVIGNK
jgi:hypothetical protein